MDKRKGQHTVTMTDAEVAEYNQMQTDWNSNAEKLKRIKEIRKWKLNETDWWVFRGDMTDEQKHGENLYEIYQPHFLLAIMMLY